MSWIRSSAAHGARLSCLLAPGALLAAASAAQSVKLSAPLALASGDVTTYQVTPDGSAVVYLTARATLAPGGGLAHEFLVVPTDASQPPLLLFDSLEDWDEAQEERENVAQAFQILHDGSALVFSSTELDGSQGRRRLYRLALDGSGPAALLWENPFSSSDTLSFELTADDGWIVLHHFATSTLSIQSVRMDGGATVVLAGTGAFSQGIGFALTPDGSRVVFGARGTTTALFSALPNGQQRVNLSGTLPTSTDIGGISVTPDGSLAVYRVDVPLGVGFELFAVPVLGGVPTKLSGTLVASGSVAVHELSPDSSRVVYLADALVDERRELFSVPLDGTRGPRRLSGTLPATGDVQSFQISPDSRRVVYRANQRASDLFELFSAPIDGSARHARRLDGPAPAQRVRLNGALVAGGDVGSGFQIGPGGERVVYQADQDVDEVLELYSVPIDASRSPVKLSGPLVAGGDAFLQAIDAAGRVYYTADANLDAAAELFSAPLDGSEPALQLSAPLSDWGDVDSTRPAGGGRVLYRADAKVNETFELFAAPGDGSSPAVRLSGPLDLGPARGNVADFRLDAGSGRAVYRAEVEVYGRPELFSVKLDGPAGHVKLHPALVGGVRAGYVLDPASGRVVFTGEQQLGAVSLFSAPVDASAAAVELVARLGSAGDVLEFQLDPLEGRVVFLADPQPADEVFRLFSVALAGQDEPLELSGAIVSGGDVQSGFRVSPDGNWVVFVADRERNEKFQLYRASTAGKTGLLELSPPLTASQDVGTLAIAPDGTRVAFTANANAQAQTRLYAVPLDGSAAAVDLVGPLASGGNVQPDYRFSPGGERLVFRADRSSDEVFELFSVPADGSQPPVELSGALAASGDVAVPGGGLVFDISADGARVVYVADQSTDEQLELFSAPIDGSQAPVRLNGALIAAGDVGSPGTVPFLLAPDGLHVVYRADALTDSVFELYRAPLDGSLPPIRLSAPGHSVSDFALRPDGRVVAYLAASPGAPVRLFRVPLDGHQPPRLANGPLVPGGSVRSFQFGADGRLAYLADQDTASVVELYLSTGF